jgi:hypothetical protein
MNVPETKIATRLAAVEYRSLSLIRLTDSSAFLISESRLVFGNREANNGHPGYLRFYRGWTSDKHVADMISEAHADLYRLPEVNSEFMVEEEVSGIHSLLLQWWTEDFGSNSDGAERGCLPWSTAEGCRHRSGEERLMVRQATRGPSLTQGLAWTNFTKFSFANMTAFPAASHGTEHDLHGPIPPVPNDSLIPGLSKHATLFPRRTL